MEKLLALVIIGIIFRMNRAGITMVSASLLLPLGVLDFETAWLAIDGKTF